jgi:hypothetical protein
MKPNWMWAVLVGIAVAMLFRFGPEFFRFNQWRVYTEIQELKARVSNLEEHAP